jgi:hypothetical protein
MKSCTNPHCNRQVRKIVRGLCPACYKYHGVHGRLRTSVRVNRRRHEITLCRRCRCRPADHTQTLCRTCYRYQWSTGRPRPRYRDSERCTNCNRPHGPERPHGRKGLCANCYDYKWRYGRERPERLIKRTAPAGWCDCGQPATAVIDIGELGKMALCSRCQQLEESTK